MSEQRITQIPLPGSSGRTPTGAIQFQDDWPGLFVRGDDAIGLLFGVRQLERILGEKYNEYLPQSLKRIVEIIEGDVIVRKESRA